LRLLGAAELIDAGVDRAEPGRRIVFAHARRPVLAHDAVSVVEEEDAAVVRVGHRYETVRQQIGVVRRVEVARRRALDVDVPVPPEDASARERDDLDRVLVFLVGDDPVELRPEEGVVVEPERHRRVGAG
jgi:hypothetical protein